MPRDRANTERDDRMRAGMLAILTTRSMREASKACGIPRITLERWRDSDEGKALLAEMSSSDGASTRVARMWKLVDKALDQLEAALDAGKIPPTALAVNIGILSDKAKQMGTKNETDTGEIVVQVFGGTLGGGGAPAQGMAVQVTTKKGGGGS